MESVPIKLPVMDHSVLIIFLAILFFGTRESYGIDQQIPLVDGKTHHTLITSPNIVHFESAKYRYCSGSLTSPTQVLTSARCIDGMKSAQLHIHSYEGRHVKRYSESLTTIDELGVIELTSPVRTNFSVRHQSPIFKYFNATVALWEFVNDTLTKTLKQVLIKKKENGYFNNHPNVPCKPNVGAPLYLDGTLIGVMSPDECGKTFIPVDKTLGRLNNNVECCESDYIRCQKCVVLLGVIGFTAIIAYFWYLCHTLVLKSWK